MLRTLYLTAAASIDLGNGLEIPPSLTYLCGVCHTHKHYVLPKILVHLHHNRLLHRRFSCTSGMVYDGCTYLICREGEMPKDLPSTDRRVNLLFLDTSVQAAVQFFLQKSLIFPPRYKMCFSSLL